MMILLYFRNVDLLGGMFTKLMYVLRVLCWCLFQRNLKNNYKSIRVIPVLLTAVNVAFCTL